MALTFTSLAGLGRPPSDDGVQVKLSCCPPSFRLPSLVPMALVRGSHRIPCVPRRTEERLAVRTRQSDGVMRYLMPEGIAQWWFGGLTRS